jgi:hypothetical protein
MVLPNEIKLAIQQAIAHSNGTEPNRAGFGIGVKDRRRIYESFDFLGKEIGRKARAWLAIITTKHVIEKFPDKYLDFIPESKNYSQLILHCGKGLLELAEQILNSKDPVPNLDEKTKKFVNAGFGFQKTARYFYKQIYSVLLGYTCVLVAKGEDPFLNTTPEYNDAYEDYLDFPKVPKTDAARYAVDALANTQQDFDYNVAVEFWNWWLDEAIPQAWELATRK